MHQFETIIAAVELAMQHNSANAIPAILKEYIMDDGYVAKQDRHELLVLINNKLDTKYSLTNIKKGNPVILKTLPFELPEKAVLVRTDKVIGATEIPADSALINQSQNTAAQQGTTEMQTNAQQSQAQESNQSSNTELGNTMIQDNTKPGKPGKKDKAKKDKPVIETEEVDLGKAEAKRFAKAFVDAHAKGKVKKDNRHVKLTFNIDSIDEFGINVIYEFMRPTIKFMVNAIKELPGMKEADDRATMFETWVKGDEDRAKAFKRFNKRVGKSIEKQDHIMALFLLMSPDNLRWSIDFANYAYTETEAAGSEAGDDTYAFVRENSNGVNPRWTAAAGAVIGGTVDMAMNGFDVSAIIGTAAATGGAFFAGGLLEDQIENPHLRDFTAGALGGVMGVGGARIGRNIGRALSDSDDTMVEQSDSTVVATIPAQVITQRTEPVQESGGMLSGLTSFMMS